MDGAPTKTSAPTARCYPNPIVPLKKMLISKRFLCNAQSCDCGEFSHTHVPGIIPPASLWGCYPDLGVQPSGRKAARQGLGDAGALGERRSLALADDKAFGERPVA